MSGISLIATLIISVVSALGIGTFVGLFINRVIRTRQLEDASQKASQILNGAEEEKKVAVLEAKEEALRLRSTSENEIRERRREIHQVELRLDKREGTLETRREALERQGDTIKNKEYELEQIENRLKDLESKQLTELEAVSRLTLQEARDTIVKKAEIDMEHEVARRYKDIEQQYSDEAESKARKLIALAIQRLASDVVQEGTVKQISIPNDEMKGRLIGREGRNIRAIEQATGVDLIIDDTPQAVNISCFDPIRREVARVTLENLIADGRIHPTRVEEMAEKGRLEVEETIKQAGQQAIFDAGVRGMHPDLIKLLGRLKFRTSYGGNVLQHSVEASLLAGMIASELGADVQVSKAGALLHDIGKALTHEIEGSHAEIGAEMAAKYQIPDPVRQAIEEHHDDDKGSVEAFIVVAADAISSARPGARRDTVEQYIKRMTALEEVGNGFPGVKNCYAVQAGREIRIMVQPEDVDDVTAPQMARNIAKRIEDTLAFPGQIKVTVIRETRAVEYAR